MDGNSARKRILIIEDEGYIYELLYCLLTQGDRYEVLTAGDGEKGLEMAGKERPDLVFLDVMLPKINGIEVCRRLKESERTKPIPVVLMTANAKMRQLAAEEVSADRIIAKPFNLPEVVEIVEKLLGPAGDMP